MPAVRNAEYQLYARNLVLRFQGLKQLSQTGRNLFGRCHEHQQLELAGTWNSWEVN
jgi:hypothetical protein